MEGRIVAIPGAASGISLSIALLMASLGTGVSIANVCRQEELNKSLTNMQQPARDERNMKIYLYNVHNVFQFDARFRATADG